jgi:hypothetical protein
MSSFINTFIKFSIILFLSIKMKSENICNLKIADNELSSVKGGADLIYNDAIINDNWDENNTFSPHIASALNEIEYLYSTEVHTGSSTHEKMVI